MWLVTVSAQPKPSIFNLKCPVAMLRNPVCYITSVDPTTLLFKRLRPRTFTTVFTIIVERLLCSLSTVGTYITNKLFKYETFYLPSYISSSTVRHVSPECVCISFIRIQVPECINKTISEQLRHSLTLFVCKTCVLSIRLRIS